MPTAWRLPALAAGLLLLSRLPFLIWTPDWGLIHWEHCFHLSAPEVLRLLEAQAGEALPFWRAQPNAYEGHYVKGMHGVGYLIYLLGHWTGWTLRTARAVAVLETLAFVVIYAWVLQRVFPGPDERTQRLVPLGLCILPPALYLAATTTPIGGVTDSDLVYAVFLPFWLPALRGHLRWPTLVVYGLLAGAAGAWLFLHLYTAAIPMLLYLLCGRDPWPRRIAAGVLVTALMVLSFSQLAALGAVLGKFTGSVAYATSVAENSIWQTVADNVSLTFSREVLLDGRYSRLGFLRLLPLPSTWDLPLALGLGLLFAGGLAMLLRALWDLLRPRVREDTSLARRFVGAHGLFAGGFVVAYHLVDIQTARDLYPVVLYPAVFVGVGALLQACPARARLPVVGLCAGLLAVGWIGNVRYNARPLNRPQHAGCLPLTIDGFFSGARQGDAGPERYPARGEQLCLEALGQKHPEAQQDCRLKRYTQAAEFWDGEQNGPPRCTDGDLQQQLDCARGFGAALHSNEICGAPEGEVPDIPLCESFDGPRKEACVGGAWQGYEYAAITCKQRFESRCDHAAWGEDRPWCLEAGAAFMSGAPRLPWPRGEVPERCQRWPRPWQGLCAEAVAQAQQPRPEAESCEDVYRRLFAHSIPADAQMATEHCLAAGFWNFGYCAVGVARRRGWTDCAWRGDAFMATLE